MATKEIAKTDKVATMDLVGADEEMINRMTALASKDDGNQKMPVLKINYDVESIHERGVWVVGQAKDKDGNISDEGDAVDGLIIVDVRNRYNFYNQTDISKNCSSPYHRINDTVRGVRLGCICGKQCPNRAVDLNPRCKAQKVVFGIAVTKGKRLIDCVAYIQGSSYIPFADYHKALTNKKTKGGYVTIPPFAFLTLLGSEKKKNAGTIFFEGQFAQGGMFPIEVMEKYAKKREQVTEYIDNINRIVMEMSKIPGLAEPEPVRASARVEAKDVPLEFADAEIVDASEVASPAISKKVETKVSDVIATSDDDFDIEAAIKAAIKKPAGVATGVAL